MPVSRARPIHRRKTLPAVLEGTALGGGPVQDHIANAAATTRLTAKRIAARRLACHDRLQLCRVEVLLKAPKFAVLKAPHVAELSVEFPAGGLVRARVTAFDDDGLTGVMDRAYGNCEAVPLRADPHEKILEHGLRPDPDSAVLLVRVTFGLAPFDFRMEGGQHCRNITAPEGGVNVFGELYVAHDQQPSTSSPPRLLLIYRITEGPIVQRQ